MLILLILPFVIIVYSQGGIDKTRHHLQSALNNIGRGPDTPPYLTAYYRVRHAYFVVEPIKKNAIMFLGDSMTDEGDWSKLFSNEPTINFGIGGDTTLGLLNRMDQVVAAKPKKIFLMIGTNDLCFNRSIPATMKNYNEILHILKTKLPHTQVYIESVLPFNDTIFPSNYLRTNENIKKLNVQIKALAQKYDYPYINMAPAFTGPDGRLPAAWTVDGLHLNEKGYAVWRDQVAKYVKQ